MTFDARLVQRVSDLLHAMGERGARQKNVFGGRGFLRGKSTFLVVWDDGLIVKTARSEYAGALTMRGVTPFAPGGEKAMSTWVVVEAAEVAEDPELREWIERALRSLAGSS
ncbi:MAG TPA: TfoX/Sxy family protein [Gemmatimonadaceae bacterium]|nr:TfoX/Sxy family protein [Gemmatimonadaceae bacterium]